MRDPSGLDRNFLQRLLDAVGIRVSRAGERLGIDGLIYNRLLFNHFDRFATQSAGAVAGLISSMCPDAVTLLDVGSGSGAYASAFRDSGLRVIALERSPHGRRIAMRAGVDCRDFDLTRRPPADVNGRFGVVCGFEVAEHLPPEMSEPLVHFIATHARKVFFTAAPPGQLGIGHINCQPREFWIRLFADHDMLLDEGGTAFARDFLAEGKAVYWLVSNMMVFESTNEAKRNTQA